MSYATTTEKGYEQAFSLCAVIMAVAAVAGMFISGHAKLLQTYWNRLVTKRIPSNEVELEYFGEEENTQAISEISDSKADRSTSP